MPSCHWGPASRQLRREKWRFHRFANQVFLKEISNKIFLNGSQKKLKFSEIIFCGCLSCLALSCPKSRGKNICNHHRKHSLYIVCSLAKLCIKALLRKRRIWELSEIATGGLLVGAYHFYWSYQHARLLSGAYHCAVRAYWPMLSSRSYQNVPSTRKENLLQDTQPCRWYNAGHTIGDAGHLCRDRIKEGHLLPTNNLPELKRDSRLCLV